jgi:hypothetical protein
MDIEKRFPFLFSRLTLLGNAPLHSFVRTCHAGKGGSQVSGTSIEIKETTSTTWISILEGEQQKKISTPASVFARYSLLAKPFDHATISALLVTMTYGLL